MTYYAFRLQAECVPPSGAVETCVGRYDVMAMSAEAAATAARQLFVAEMSRRRLRRVGDISAVEVVPLPRGPLDAPPFAELAMSTNAA